MPAARDRIDSFHDLYIPEPNSGCWLWIGSVASDGYSRFRGYGGSISGHSFSYWYHVGPVPEGHELDHICRVRCCVNPAHLRPLTHADNVALADFTKNHRNGRKTHCLRGHELSGDNLLVERWRHLTMRKCRACKKYRLERAK